MFRSATIVILILSALRGPLSGDWLSMGLVASPTEVRECGEEELKIAFAIRNPSAVGVAGFDAFLRYPADLFEPIAYVQGDMQGITLFNGPPPLGEGYAGCDPAGTDPWDDGAGRDVASVAASAFSGAGSSGAIVAQEATLGWFTFRLRPDAVLPSTPVKFALEFDPCDPDVYCRNTLYDAAGKAFDIQYSSPVIEVGIRKGVKVDSFSCEADPEGVGLLLRWTPPVDLAFDGVNVYRNGELFRSRVPPQIQEVSDPEPPAQYHYEVAVIVGGKEESCRSRCGSQESSFIRGDADGDKKSTLTDVVTILLYLFQGGSLACLDAGDFDDSGALDLSDAVGVLTFLFQGGNPPAAPYPASGPDPTLDTLDCNV
jgi:hypothetical protein